MLSKHQQPARLASPSFRRVLPLPTMDLDALIVHPELEGTKTLKKMKLMMNNTWQELRWQ
jgi:hypothetical protein